MKDGRRNECTVCTNKIKHTSRKRRMASMPPEEKEQHLARDRYYYLKRRDYWAKRYEKSKSKSDIAKKYAQVKINAKRRGIDFQISKAQYEAALKSACYLCENQATGLDRLNSDGPYSIENVLPCCAVCNRMKLNHALPYFLNHLKMILKKHGDL